MTRREFLEDAGGALAGIAFVGCSLAAATPVSAQARRREVVVSGRRAKVVDVHAHCAVPEAMALMGLKLGAPGSNLPPLLHMATQAAERLASMPPLRGTSCGGGDDRRGSEGWLR